ncbi:nuclear pore complex protein Nup98-Nup96 [Protopterus annectens]|uniref:nuclear pore complex protein Nup98-Nup96 n=1 Tax=Protopterus annectens TaxID=7888 RepID=UPI001CF95DA3|nr:nuclear pore complex protein Nup98-Nup96 [Protopterus annectens]
MEFVLFIRGLFGTSTFNQPATSSTSTGFGFGASTGTSTSLFGSTSTGGGLFSHNAFTQNKPGGFGRKFVSKMQRDSFVSFLNKELRFEDYQAGRKGPQNPIGAPGSLFGTSTATSSASTSLFGAANTNPGFSFGANKAGFGTTSTAFGTSTGGLFGQTTQGTSLFSKPFGQTTTAPNTGFSFGNTSTLGQPNTSNVSLFGTAPASQPGGLFGSTTTNAATGFGTGTGLFGQPNTAFGSTGTPSLFGNKTAGFGTTTTSAPSFGTTGGGLFGFGSATAGASLFGNKAATGTLGTGLSTGFGTALNPGQTSLFGNNQPKLGTTLGPAFGTTAFNPSGTSLNFGAAPASVALTDPNAAAVQQAALQQQISSLTYAPFGDSPLFRNPMSDPKKKEERLKPTNPAAQKALTTPTHYKLTPRPATRVRPKALQTVGSTKSQLFDGLDDDEPSVSNGTFMPRKSIKKLVLKNLNSNSLYSPGNRESEELTSSEYLENGERTIENHRQEEDEREDDDHELMKFYTNPITKPIPQTPDSLAGKQHLNHMDDTIAALNMRNSVRSGLEVSSEETSFNEESLQEEREEELEIPCPSHPAGNGDECYGSVYFEGKVNLTKLNLDEIVHIRRKEVIVYPDDDQKPPTGEGLNRRAQVTLDGVWPTDKTSRELIKSPERLLEMKYEERLECASRKQGARFLEYRPETGSWVFEVSHFSKYGLQDSDEEDEEQVSKMEVKKQKVGSLQTPMQQQALQTALNGHMPSPVQVQSPPVEQLGRVTELDSDMIDITQEPIPDDMTGDEIAEEHEPMSASTHIASSLGINPHALQIMKASLFMEEEEDVGMLHGERPERLTSHIDDFQESHCLSSVHRGRPSAFGLLQSKYMSEVSPFRSYPQNSTGKKKSLTTESSFVSWSLPAPLPVPASELQLKTIGARRQQGLVPIKKSVTVKKGKFLMDMALFMGRSFRVGWSPSCILTHSGDILRKSTEIVQNHSADTDGYGFFTGVKQFSDSAFNVSLEKVSFGEQRTEQDIQLFLVPLEIELKNSSVNTEKLCPVIQTNPGVTALHAYASWIREVCKSQNEVEDVVKHWKLVWTLCEAIWGHLKELEGGLVEPSEYIQQLERRKAFSAWLSQTAEDKIEKEVFESKQNNHIEAVFSYLTGQQISEACSLLQQSDDHRLALLVSQAAGSQTARELLTMQLVDWHGLQADSFIQEERLRILALLSAKPVWQSSKNYINVCSKLDWKRCLAVHLWYMLPPTASIASALKMYEEAFQNSSHSSSFCCIVLPSYMEGGCSIIQLENPNTPLRQICTNLPILFLFRHYDLQQLLDPSTITPDPLDYRLSWHLWMVLQALNYSHLSLQRQGLLHTSYASQLESVGLWEWSIFVLLHISDPQM